MWKHEVSVFTTATPHAVWRLFTDVAHYPRWAPEAEWARLSGPFRVGSLLELKLRAGPTLKLRLTEVEPDHRFVARARGPLLTVQLEHEVRRTAHGVRIVLRLRMRGPLARVLGALLGRRLRAAYDQAAMNLARLAPIVSGVLPSPEAEPPRLMH